MRIAKTYKTLWQEGMRLNASDVRRAFDDAYDLVNGGLDSANFIQQVTFNGSSIITSSQAFSGTVLTSIIEEIKITSEHTLHFFAYNGTIISIFPGFAYINGVRCKNSSRINVTASDVNLTGGNLITGLHCILIGNGLSNAFTASDVRVTLASNISQSLCWNNDKQGYYPTIASGNRRAFMYFRGQTAANVLLEEQYLDPPWSTHVYDVVSSEAIQFGLSEFTVTQTNGFNVQRLTRTWDSRDRRYTYTVKGTGGGGAGTSAVINTLFCGTGFQISGAAFSILDGVFASHVNNEHYPYQPQLADQNAFSVLNDLGVFNLDNRSIPFTSADYSLRFGRIYKNYRNKGERG